VDLKFRKCSGAANTRPIIEVTRDSALPMCFSSVACQRCRCHNLCQPECRETIKTSLSRPGSSNLLPSAVGSTAGALLQAAGRGDGCIHLHTSLYATRPHRCCPPIACLDTGRSCGLGPAEAYARPWYRPVHLLYSFKYSAGDVRIE
jgi:hypothetical protein